MRQFSDNTQGAMLMMAAMAFFTFNDACMKAVSAELPSFQAIFLRGLGCVALLLALAGPLGGLRVHLGRRDRRLVAIRTLAEIGATYFFITALFHMPLANITAILQATPLAVTLAGALFLGETVGWRRFAAILVGFGGVLLIVRPGTEGFSIYSVYGLISVACVTVRDLATRRLSAAVPSLTVAFGAALGVALFGVVGMAGADWVPVSPSAWLLLLGAAAFLVGGYLCAVMVMRVGDIGTVAPFRYTSLIWALLLGLVAFGDWPQPLTLIGAAIVVATGIYTLLRERRLGRKPVVPLRMR